MLRVTTYLRCSITAAASSSTSARRIILYRCNGRTRRGLKQSLDRATPRPFSAVPFLSPFTIQGLSGEKLSGLLFSSSSMYEHMIHNLSWFVNRFLSLHVISAHSEDGMSFPDLLRRHTHDK